jgi:peptidoglycan/xylan/chitin deacetylase (PgdA/CDA1 family)
MPPRYGPWWIQARFNWATTPGRTHTSPVSALVPWPTRSAANADFLRNTYGVDGTPYFRPPFGVHTTDTDRVAADLGYPTITLWSGAIGDSRPENGTSLIANASGSFQPQQIVLAHANLPTITHCYPQLLDIIGSRNLQTVTLNDVFA